GSKTGALGSAMAAAAGSTLPGGGGALAGGTGCPSHGGWLVPGMRGPQSTRLSPKAPASRSDAPARIRHLGTAPMLKRDTLADVDPVHSPEERRAGPPRSRLNDAGERARSAPAAPT